MRSFRVVEHTADARIQIEADTLADLFLAGLEGLNEILKPGFCPDAPAARTVTDRIEVRAPDATVLLVDFLSEVLTRVHLRQAIFCDATLVLEGTTGLVAELTGALFDELDQDVKAVTFHEAEVARGPGGRYATALVFDL